MGSHRRRVRNPSGTTTAAALKVSPRDDTSSYKFLTPERTIERQIENMVPRFRNDAQLDRDDPITEAFLAEWDRDYRGLLEKDRFTTFLHYIGKYWCEETAVSWKLRDILNIDNITYDTGSLSHGAFLLDTGLSPTIGALHAFLEAGGIIDLKEGLGLDQTWFSKVYQFKVPLFALINKEYRETQPTDRIEYKFFADAMGITMFLHHLMLWETDDGDSDLAQGASYASVAKDMYHTHWRAHSDKEPTISHFPCVVYDFPLDVGHAIEINFWNKATRRFIYFDPWPEQTLLSTFDNVTPVMSDKRLGPDDHVLWEISPADLEKIIVACMVPFHILDSDFLRYGTQSKYILIPYER